MSQHTPQTKQQRLEEIIWNNKFIKIDGQSVYYKEGMLLEFHVNKAKLQNTLKRKRKKNNNYNTYTINYFHKGLGNKNKFINKL